MEIKLSELDKMRFGITTAKVYIDAKDNIKTIMEWCEAEKVELLIARCSTDEIKLVQSMEKIDFYLTDTLVYFQSRKIISTHNLVPEGYSWRFANAEDANSVEHLSAKTFRGHAGHYHADSKLNKLDADLVYSSWAGNSCRDENFTGVVFLIFRNAEIVAFLTMKKNDSDTCEIILNGVDPLHQRRGLYFSLISLAKNWALEQNMLRIIVSTQITNIAPQKVWSRQDFEPIKSFYTLHKWFSK
jgi:hypothetical protein